MTGPAAAEPDAGCRRVLEAALARGGDLTASELARFAGLPEEALDLTLRDFATERGAEAGPLLAALAERVRERPLRRAARRALYRLAQRGEAPPAIPARPVVERQTERAVRAWISGIDAAGSRAAWILFEGGFRTLRLCSVIVNDVTGIEDVAGGEISKKRLERELASLRESQKLPWVETDPARVVGLVAEALALHEARGTPLPAAFDRWRALFEGAPPGEPPAIPGQPDPGLVERAALLLDLPEMRGWLADPEAVPADALDLLQARESRLVVPDQVKAEREEAIVARVADRLFTDDVRRRWSRRLGEMALVFDATGRPEPAALARAAAAALADPAREARHHPFVQGLIARALEVAGEVALGQRSPAQATLRPAPETPPAAPAPAAPPRPSRRSR